MTVPQCSLSVRHGFFIAYNLVETQGSKIKSSVFIVNNLKILGLHQIGAIIESEDSVSGRFIR